MNQNDLVKKLKEIRYYYEKEKDKQDGTYKKLGDELMDKLICFLENNDTGINS